MSAATVRSAGRAGGPARPPAPSRSGTSRSGLPRSGASRSGTSRTGSVRTAGSSRATTRPTTSRPTTSRAATSRPAEGPRRTAVLRLVPPAPSQAARAPFVGVVVGLLALGLLGLLALNTSLAENSFQLHALQGQAKLLADREQVLRQEVEALQAPAALAARAEALGMVPGGPPAFLRLSDGKVLGTPTPAPAATGPGRDRGAGATLPGAAAGALPPVVRPAPERLLSRAPVERDRPEGGGGDAAASGGARDDGGTGADGARGGGTAEGATDGGATDGDATDGGGTDATTESRDDSRVDDGAVDDGAVDVGAADADDDGALDDDGTDASTSTAAGGRR